VDKKGAESPKNSQDEWQLRKKEPRAFVGKARTGSVRGWESQQSGSKTGRNDNQLVENKRDGGPEHLG